MMNNNNDDNFVKIYFELEPDDDGWPPYGGESVWAIHLENDSYQIDNTPFFVDEVSYKDIVIAIKNTEGALEFQKVSKASGHSTIRVILFNKKEKELFIKQIKHFNCSIEADDFVFVIDIPTEVKYNDILNFLENKAEENILAYEQASISGYHQLSG